jgi:hypothetical protein
MSITVCRRVRGFRKGSEIGVGVLREGIVGVGVRGLKRLRVGGSIQVYIRVYKLLVNRTKT